MQSKKATQKRCKSCTKLWESYENLWKSYGNALKKLWKAVKTMEIYGNIVEANNGNKWRKQIMEANY